MKKIPNPLNKPAVLRNISVEESESKEENSKEITNNSCIIDENNNQPITNSIIHNDFKIQAHYGHHICKICLDSADIPHKLPCGHYFCLLCILRHLRIRQNCPFCFSEPIKVSDIEGELDISDLSTNLTLPPQVFKRTESNFIKVLKKYKIRTDGPILRLQWRFNELVDQLKVEQHRRKLNSKKHNNIITPNNNQRHLNTSLTEIAWRVHKRESSVFKRKGVNRQNSLNYKAIYFSCAKLKDRYKNICKRLNHS